ncbi:phospholipase D-like domain-containing protein [Nocardioides sp. SOB77]|uniref:phospholipase D n=1 Tax=Nocardioides oceani TaxID=3058369 RepID=A0ABT8FDT1_9ACTN|nr:phospholipase D-like domain-containing protein [Nocardioides oceani]MDN4172736.1 phospholipase D-like domain-containing protein [Nocardioides oceani]
MSVVRRTGGLLALSTVLALVITLVLTLTATLLGPVPLGTPAQAAPAAAPAAARQAAPAPALSSLAAPGRRGGKGKPWKPRAGVVFNNPLGDRGQRRRIVRQVIKAIDHTPGRGEIRIASWNVRNAGITRALASAHRRGVTVRLIMSRGNLGTREDPNPGVRRLVRELSVNGNKLRRPVRRSHVKSCVSSCRGTTGISHSKFFLFSRAGASRWVVMNGSFNATDLASSNQWNDVYVVRGKPKVYGAFRRTFTEMWRDKPVRKAYSRTRVGPVTAFFYPYAGPRAKRLDPALSELKAVRCRGARNTSSGRTKVRIAMTSWFGERGTRLAWRVRRMQNNGCDVKVVYAVMGNEVLRILRREGRRPVRLQQVVQDFDGDGVYDRYLHMKVLTIKGRYRDSRRATVVVNGSANWSPAVLNSDEAVLRIRRAPVLRDYNRWIEKLYRNPPDPGLIGPLLGRRLGVLDPYAEIEVD